MKIVSKPNANFLFHLIPLQKKPFFLLFAKPLTSTSPTILTRDIMRICTRAPHNTSRTLRKKERVLLDSFIENKPLTIFKAVLQLKDPPQAIFQQIASMEAKKQPAEVLATISLHLPLLKKNPALLQQLYLMGIERLEAPSFSQQIIFEELLPLSHELKSIPGFFSKDFLKKIENLSPRFFTTLHAILGEKRPHDKATYNTCFYDHQSDRV